MTDTVGETPEQKVARLRRELEQERALLRVVFDESPDGIAVLHLDGNAQINPTAEQLFAAAAAMAASDVSADEWKHVWGFFRLDGTPVPTEQLPGVRAMAGERVQDELLRVRNPHAQHEVVALMSSAPIPTGGSITVVRDVTARVQMESELAARASELAARDDENQKLVERLRAAIDEIATPILRVADGVLVVPIIGVLDATRSARTAERVLTEVARARARSVIIEVTGAELGDTSTADAFARITRAVGLLGGRCVVSGMRPAVASTLVEIGVRLDRLPTYSSLKLALRACLEHERTRAAS